MAPAFDDVPAPADRGVAWDLDNVTLTTVGVDIGSSTSHLTFSRLWLQREAQMLSSRFVVVKRETLFLSPILLTPYRADELIDLEALEAFIDHTYRQARLRPRDVDTGAVILTGVALERANSRAIAELFARRGGTFVCASAGHILEAILAAHGSGAVATSRSRRDRVLNIDVGGGTTKLALVSQGQIEATMAVAVGARLVILGADGVVQRSEPAGLALASVSGTDVHPGRRVSAAGRRSVADTMATHIILAAQGRWSDAVRSDLHLAGALPRDAVINRITFSGGVAEFIYGQQGHDYGDLAHQLAASILARLTELPAPIDTGTERIRATVVGASQYTVQLSGNTVFLSDPSLLPLHNLPVARLPADEPVLFDADSVAAVAAASIEMLGLRDIPGPIALAVPWAVEPRYLSLRALAEGLWRVHQLHRQGLPLIVALQGDTAASVGRLMADELGARDELVILDGLDLAPLDYLDIGAVLAPANVVPVVIKSLVFPPASV